MKTSNKTLSLLVVMLVLVALLLARPANAKGADKFCQRVDVISSDMVSGMQNKKHRPLSKRSLDESRLENIRSASDSKRAESFNKLYEKYNTETQKNIIDEYRIALETALKTRREKTDIARQRFIAQINELGGNHEALINNYESKIITSIQAANSIASARCAEGEDSEIIKAAYKQSLQTAKQNFVVDRQNTELKKSKIDSLVQLRKQSIDSAMADFKLSAEAARAKLVDSLK